MRKTKDTLTYLVLLELGDEISNIDKYLDLAIKEKPLAFSDKNDILKYSQSPHIQFVLFAKLPMPQKVRLYSKSSD